MPADRDDPTRWPVPPGWTLRYTPSTGSTNDDARAAVRSGAADHTVFLADVQSTGRGRLDRRWDAPAGTSLLFSLVLQRPLPAVRITAVCSVSTAEAISRVTGLTARIKWPNDVMIGDRKACGILTEVTFHDGQRVTIVGIGLNVNLDPQTAGLPETATSLSRELGAPVSRPALLSAILSAVDRRLALDDGQLLTALQVEWEALLWRKRQRVVVSQDGSVLEGVVEGLASDGSLLLRRDDGLTVAVNVGDVFAPSLSGSRRG